MSGDVFLRKLDKMYQDCFRVKGIANELLIIDQGKGKKMDMIQISQVHGSN